MLEERKLKEIEYYDKEAVKNPPTSLGAREAGSLADFNPFLLESYQFLKNFFKNSSYKHKKVLDYGCGTGMHIAWLAENFQHVTGIDLSKASLERAKENKAENVTFVLGDCEQLPFKSKSFDVVFDGGTFSSLALDKALKEIHRVLRPGGILIGIETLGHNPLTNLKREINKILGKRTAWAASHIFKMRDLVKVKKYFEITELRFFHIISWIVFPFLNLPGGKLFLRILEKLDHILLVIFPFFKKYYFKIVFVFKKPIV